MVEKPHSFKSTKYNLLSIKTLNDMIDHVGGFVGYSSHWSRPTVHLEAAGVISWSERSCQIWNRKVKGQVANGMCTLRGYSFSCVRDGMSAFFWAGRARMSCSFSTPLTPSPAADFCSALGTKGPLSIIWDPDSPHSIHLSLSAMRISLPQVPFDKV